MADLTLKLSPEPTAPSVARRAAERQFARHLSRQRFSDLVLVISELVANAVIHGRGEVVLRLKLVGETVRGEVIDQGAGFEHEVRAHGPDDIGGRGLTLVESLTSRWGIHEGTTHVWFELAPVRHDPSPQRLEPRLGEAERPDALD